MSLPDLFRPRSNRTIYFSGEIPRMKPGMKVTAHIETQIAFRPSRIILNVQGGPPQMPPYFKKVKGSKRKGQNASVRFFADTLRHQTGKWKPDVTITNVIVGTNSQMVQGSAIPVEFFAPTSIDMGLNLDAAKKGVIITMEFMNSDFSREAWGVGAIFGRAL